MKNKDYTELIQFISEKFDGVDKEFQNMNKKMNARFNELQTSVDKAIKLNEDNKQETVVMGNRVSRNTENIATLAEATDTEIEK